MEPTGRAKDLALAAGLVLGREPTLDLFREPFFNRDHRHWQDQKTVTAIAWQPVHAGGV